MGYSLHLWISSILRNPPGISVCTVYVCMCSRVPPSAHFRETYITSPNQDLRMRRSDAFFFKGGDRFCSDIYIVSLIQEPYVRNTGGMDIRASNFSPGEEKRISLIWDTEIRYISPVFVCWIFDYCDFHIIDLIVEQEFLHCGAGRERRILNAYMDIDNHKQFHSNRHVSALPIAFAGMVLCILRY